MGGREGEGEKRGKGTGGVKGGKGKGRTPTAFWTNRTLLYVWLAARDVVHSSPQMTRSTHLTTHISSIGSNARLLVTAAIRPVI